jgi:hypothetical protein
LTEKKYFRGMSYGRPVLRPRFQRDYRDASDHLS